MNIIQALILGIIQGITEFLPVSSSGHLALFQNYIGNVNVGFDVVLHFATLLAIVVFFFKDIVGIVKDFFTWNTGSENFRMAWFIIIASVPIAFVGWFFRNFVYSLFSNLYVVALGFFISGMFLFTASFTGKRKKSSLKLGNSFVIGIAQALAIVPGISRSGATVSAGMLQGVERKKAIRFSFLLAIPAMIGANLLNFADLKVVEPAAFVVGFIAAFIFGLFAIFIFIRFLKIERFKWFAIYCWILAIITIIISFI